MQRRIKKDDIDPRMCKALNELPHDLGLEAVDKFAMSNLDNVRSKTGFMVRTQDRVSHAFHCQRMLQMPTSKHLPAIPRVLECLLKKPPLALLFQHMHKLVGCFRASLSNLIWQKEMVMPKPMLKCRWGLSRESR